MQFTSLLATRNRKPGQLTSNRHLNNLTALMRLENAHIHSTRDYNTRTRREKGTLFCAHDRKHPRL